MVIKVFVSSISGNKEVSKFKDLKHTIRVYFD